MKNNFTLIGMMALALAACDKKEEVTQKAAPPLNTRTSSAERHASSPKPKPPVETEIADAPAPAPEPEPEQAQSAPPAFAPAVVQAAPVPAPASPLSTSGKTTEQLRDERLARMEKAREDRIAQTTTQLTARFKQQDANGDGFLSKDEVDGRMQRRFADADKNKDGYLDATEQAAMIQSVADRAGDGGQRRGGQNGGGQNGGFANQGRRNRNL
jgi:type IV secretory pathway VirB10-like protein